MNPWTDLLLGIFFTAIGIIVALWYENLGATQLLFSAMETSDKMNVDGRRTRFLHVLVTNKPRKMWLVTRQTAFSCHGNIQFFDEAKNSVGKGIPIKWDGTPEPVKYEIAPNGEIKSLYDPRLIRATKYIDIPPDESESLAFAVRIYDDDCAYGWTTESYIYNWRLRDCVLPPGIYTAKINVVTGDGTFSKEFNFEISMPFERFDLISTN